MALALATYEQLMARTSIAPDPTRAAAVLEDASAAVRAYTGQSFTRATTTAYLRTFCCGQVRLPQRPVHEIIAVTTAGTEPTDVAYTFDGVDRLTVSALYDVVAVEYDHGYDPEDMPGEIIAVIAAISGRTMAIAPEDAGVTQRSITNYSESFGTVGAAGSMGLFTDEMRILNRYRRPGASIRVGCR